MGFFNKKIQSNIRLLSEEEKNQEIEKIKSVTEKYELVDVKLPNLEDQQLEISGFLKSQQTQERFYFRSWFVWDGWSIITLHHDNQEKSSVSDLEIRKDLYRIILTFCYSKQKPRLISINDRDDYEGKILKIIVDKIDTLH